MTKQPHADQTLPKPLLIGAGLLIGATLLMTGLARTTGIGVSTAPRGTPVTTLQLHFADREDGGVTVISDDHREQVVEPGSNGFLRATMRGLVRERRREGIGPDAPFVLTRWSDGALSLTDPTTNRSVRLEAFGPTNAQAFARLLPAGDATR